MDKKISELPVATVPLSGSEKFEILQGGVNKQVDASDVASGTSIPYGATSGTNTYTIAATPAVTAYADGAMYHIRVGTSSTGVITLNFDSVGAKKVLRTDGGQASSGHFLAGVDYIVAYNSALDTGAGAFVVVNELQHGLMNMRGVYDASANAYPSVGGSGVAGAVRHGDTWIVSVAGTVSAGVDVNIGDMLTTGVDAPGQTASLWYVIPGKASLDSKVDEETFTVLTDGATVVWDCNNRQIPTAKLTCTQSFTWDIINVKDAARGIVKLITNTASAIVMTFDTSFTNKMLNVTMASYTFPALTGQDYFLSWVYDAASNVIEWVIGDIAVTAPGARVQRAANQVIGSDATNYTAVSFDTVNADNGSIWGLTPNPTRLTIPGTGNKRAYLTGWVQWDASATGERRILINKTGASTAFSDGIFSRVIGTSGIPTIVPIGGQIDCVGGDYLEVMTFQNSTANRNVIASISISIFNR